MHIMAGTHKEQPQEKRHKKVKQFCFKSKTNALHMHHAFYFISLGLIT